MKNIKKIICIATLLSFIIGCGKNETTPSAESNNDDYYEKCRKLVLSENRIGQEYVFKIKKKEVDEFTLTYLGGIKTSKGDTLKILNAINYFGLYEESKRANGFVFIYDGKNQRVGRYYVGGASSVAAKVEDNNLVFSYHDESCNQTTSISFLDSIPQQIFVNCTEKGGDLYSFSTE